MDEEWFTYTPQNIKSHINNDTLYLLEHISQHTLFTFEKNSKTKKMTEIKYREAFNKIEHSNKIILAKKYTKIKLFCDSSYFSN